MISVCMATYNGEEHIVEQIESILCQLDTSDELIVSDDGSVDKTIELVESFYDSRIKIFRNNGHSYTRNFENALMNAHGDYLFLCDQDDVWMDNKIKLFMKCFEETKCDFIVSDATVVDKDKKVIYQSYFEEFDIKTGFVHNLLSTRYIGACMAFKREMLDRILPIPGIDKYIAHDYWITCIAERYYNVQLLKQQVMLYVRHGNNTSTAFGKSKMSIWDRIYKRFYTLYFIEKRK